MRAALLCVTLLFVAPGAFSMTLTSTDIRDGGKISAAQIYPRCGGQNVSPALSWSGAPPKTQSYVLTVIDLDVKPSEWSHWIVVDLPRSVTQLARGTKTLPEGAHAVQSNFGDPNYDGPCPPAGTGTHHYKITAWAMPVPSVVISPDAPARDLAAMLEQRAIAKASITGTVTR